MYVHRKCIHLIRSTSSGKTFPEQKETIYILFSFFSSLHEILAQDYSFFFHAANVSLFHPPFAGVMLNCITMYNYSFYPIYSKCWMKKKNRCEQKLQSDEFPLLWMENLTHCTRIACGMRQKHKRSMRMNGEKTTGKR